VRIAIDVMGGDHAPGAILDGVVEAVDQVGAGDQLVLFGDAEIIAARLTEAGLAADPRLEVVGTTESIGMDESPVAAVRTKVNSSIVCMAKAGSTRAPEAQRCDMVISAGNTGACVAAAQMAMRRLPGVHRPGIAAPIPTFHGSVILCDVGANPEPRPSHLHQYAHMASIYATSVFGIDNPRVGLLSIGEEEGKGNQIVRDTHMLVKDDPALNYVGYVEGREIFEGKTDVLITEGFTGNVVLKLVEGLSSGLFRTILSEVAAVDPQLAERFKPVVKTIYAKHDYHEYGGAPLLGINGACLICHGASVGRTIANAVRTSTHYVQTGVNDHIVEALGKLEPAGEGSE